MKKLIIFLAGLALTFVMSGPAFAGFTQIAPGSASEKDLWEALELVTNGTWTSTAYLNTGAGGRRVDDSKDQIWMDGTIGVTSTALFWGGSATPTDTLGQELVYDTDLSGGSPTLTGVKFATLGATQTFSASQFILGDNSSNPLAWSVPSLNTPNASGEMDRMVTFDVTGLNVYAWNTSSSAYDILVRSSTETGPAYILGFDPGTDGDFQDMIVLIEGACPIPAPGAILLGSIGVGLVGWLRRRRTL